MLKREVNDLRFLIRKGNENHIHNLYKEGEIYINTINFIRQCDNNIERSDPYDSIAKREFLGELKVKMCDCGLDINKYDILLNATDGQMSFDTTEKGNIYCFTGIYNDHFLDEKEIIEILIESFGESVIIILKPFVFIKRLIKALNDIGYKVYCCPVEYYPNDYSGDIGYFKKHENYKYQNEFRFFIPNLKDELIKLNIGSLEDIALIHKSCFLKLELTDSRTKIIKIA